MANATLKYYCRLLCARWQRIIEEEVLKRIIQHLDEKDSVREAIIRKTRDLIRSSKKVIQLCYQGKLDEAQNEITNMTSIKHELWNQALKYPDLLYGGTMLSALVEYVEAFVIFYLMKERKVPRPEDLDAEYTPYLLGLADALCELRRFILENIRKGALEDAEQLLNVMEEIYLRISLLNYPDGLLPGFRRKCDIVRRLIDETKSDLILAKNAKMIYEVTNHASRERQSS